MTFRDMLGTAVSNLGRHKARTGLTMVGVIVGILTIVTMVSLGNGVRGEMRAAFDAVGIESIHLYPVAEDVGDFTMFGMRPRTKLLTPELVSSLAARDDVVVVTPYLNVPSGVRATLRLDGQEVSVDPYPRPVAAVGEPFEVPVRTLAGAGEPPPEGGAIVVTDSLLASFGYQRADAAALVGRTAELAVYAPRGESETFPVTIAGVTTYTWSDLALAEVDLLALLEWWYNDPDYMAHRGYDEVLIRARSLNDAVHIVDWLDAQGYHVESVKTMVDLVNRGMTVLTTMLGSVGGLALFVASIGIANTMIMSVYERTKEIGILKAVGAAPRQIRGLFVIEASLIGLMGGVIGTVLGWLLGEALNWLMLEIMAWQDVPMEGTFFVITWWLVLGALIFATLVGLLAGLYPAARAARLVPLDALRYE